MSYDISWRVKVDGVDLYVEVFDPECNITWNVGEIIRKSTGLEWKNEEDNGLVKDVMPKIVLGLHELMTNGDKYKHLEPDNGWGTVASVKRFFERLISKWNEFCEDYWTRKLTDHVHFWIV